MTSAWVFAYAVAVVPLVMQGLFSVAAVVLCVKVQTAPTVMLALGAVLGTVGLFVLTAPPPLGAYSSLVQAISSILQGVGFLWFVLGLPKRHEGQTLARADVDEAPRRST